MKVEIKRADKFSRVRTAEPRRQPWSNKRGKKQTKEKEKNSHVLGRWEVASRDDIPDEMGILLQLPKKRILLSSTRASSRETDNRCSAAA